MEPGYKVSIIMPVYNEEIYLNDCINSIINQNFYQWELIAVDDFSTDNSFEILNHFSAIDSRIKVIKNTSKGIIPALRMAWQNSNGDFITRMDADDIMPENKLLQMATALSSLPEGTVVTGKVEYFSEGILENGFFKYQQWLNSLCDAKNHWNQIYKECVIPSACWMTRQADLNKIHAFSESQYPEDYDLVFRLYKANYQVFPIPEILHFWRDHPKRASRNDPNYADQTFFDLKLHYFLSTDYNANSQLVLWGSGKKGKKLAKLLIHKNISFLWVSNNQKKWGHYIYGVQIVEFTILKKISNRQIIISISDRKFEIEKSNLINDLNLNNHEIFEFL